MKKLWKTFDKRVKTTTFPAVTDEDEEEGEDDSLRGSDKFWVRYEVHKGENKREVNQQLFSKSNFQVNFDIF